MTARSIRLPDRFYLPRVDADGREVRDVMPWDGALSYATDGERLGIQYADGSVVWLGRGPGTDGDDSAGDDGAADPADAARTFADDYVYVVERDGELSDEDQRFIAALHPDAALRLVKEIRRLRRVEERHESLCSVLQHLNNFLERRGLVAQAQRFVEVRAQLERIQPDGYAPDAAPTAADPARSRVRPVSVV